MPQRRDFFASGSGIVALVFSILGLAFLIAGAGLAFSLLANEATDQSTTAGEPRWVLSLIFLSIGTGFAAVGMTLGWRRVASLRMREALRKYGRPVTGKITSVDQNVSVRLNGRHPWIIRYDYNVGGMQYHGTERTFDLPVGLASGAQIGILYDGEDPRRSVLDLK
jgi:hypothetical protein